MIGRHLKDRYQIEAELGAGGMGVVYQAYDPELKRSVAVKVLPGTSLSQESRTRLREEAQAVARFKHPNIVVVHDFGEVDSSPYIVMELLDGVLLSERLPLPIDEVIRIAEQICSALEHAHSRGIIHRDLKPGNITLEPDGNAKLMDFGLARSDLADSDSVFAGTVAYTPPEQITGGPIDERADLYSFGVMLYEMVTGQLPFQAEDPIAMIFQHRHAAVIPPMEVEPGVPQPLSELIVHLLAKRPADRPGSARELLAELKELSRLTSAPSLLQLWRDQGVEILEPANLAIVLNSSATVTFGQDDLLFLIRSALHSEMVIEPWMRVASSPAAAFQALEQVLREKPGEDVRLRVVQGLTFLETPQSADLLLELALKDPAPLVRSTAAIAAARAGRHGAVAEKLRDQVVAQDPIGLEAFAALVDEVGLPEGFGGFPRIPVWRKVFLRRWQVNRSRVLRRSWLGGLGAALLLGLNGAAAPLYVYIRSQVDFYDTLLGITIPAWVLSAVVIFALVGLLQGFTSVFFVGLSDMFQRGRPLRRRVLVGAAAGLVQSFMLIGLTSMANQDQAPPAPVFIVNLVYFVYGLFFGAALTLVIPPQGRSPSIASRLPWILASMAICAALTLPYVSLVYAEEALGQLPVRLVMGTLLPLGIALGLRWGAAQSGHWELADQTVSLNTH